MPSRYSLIVMALIAGNVNQIVMGIEETPSNMTKEEINAMLDSHNDLRSKVEPPGSNIRFLTWDTDLANHAQAYSDKCIFAHSSKYTFDPYGNIGENIYISTANVRANLDKIEGITKAWFKEKNYYDYETNDCQPNKMCGHYTQVVWDNTYKVGCGITHCTEDVQVRTTTFRSPFIVVCKYGPAGNVRRLFSRKTRRPYSEGQWCSNCPKEAPFCRNHLCHTDNITTNVQTTIQMTQQTSTKITPKSTQPDTTIKISSTTVGPTAKLRCNLCEGMTSATSCLSVKRFKTCGNDFSSRNQKRGHWSCISFWEAGMVKMDCISKSTCKKMALDKDKKVTCCEEDLCNIGSGSTQISGKFLSISIFFTFVTFILNL